MKKIFLIIFLLFSYASFSQDKSAVDLLNSIQKKFNSFNYLSADFSQRIIASNNFRGTELAGKFYYKKDGAYRIEIKNRVLLNDGKNIYNIDNRLSRVVISNIDDAASSFSLQKIVFEYPKKCKVILLEEDGAKILEMSSNDNSLSFKKVFLYTKEDNIPSEVKIIDLAGNQTIIRLNNIVINAIIPATKFIYNEMKGFEIVDLR
ncbi:MAG: hypothetical protein Fur0015_01580 [Ignavibacteriales bacterium]